MEETIRERISFILRERKISIAQLAREGGSTRRKLQSQINQDTQITIETVYLFLKFFKDVNPLWLLYGEDNIWGYTKYTEIINAGSINAGEQMSKSLVQELLNRIESLAQENTILKFENNNLKSELTSKKEII